ncbi:MAG: NUDIX domain-containing protein [Patescibacteria group bacterium]|nr:NUDIX domain-containing protein [Patescibacteria group bacterium]
MAREKTIGIVVFRREGQGIRYLLLHHGGSYWNFPKGRQEAGETEIESALRELHEETGITDIKIVDGFKEEYDYDFDSEIINGVREKKYKTAIFFLGEVASAEITISSEHIDSGWFDYDKALERSFFQQGQNLLKKANQFLLNQQDFVL